MAANRCALVFRVMTRRVPGPRPNTVMWLARSATTAHIAHGSTEEVALERLFTGITALISVAMQQDGLSPERWLERNRVDAPRFLSEFQRIAEEMGETALPAVDGPGGVRLERTKVSQTALA